jgi:hypothetical protein
MLKLLDIANGKNLIFSLFIILSTQLLAQETGARYLIITHDSYYDALMPLAEWKRMKGFKTKIVTTAEIGSSSTEIRDYVVNAYNTWEITPEYLLLVGNKYQIPFPRMIQHSTICHSDNYYTNVSGDFHNEIIPGRFWVNDTIEAKTVVAKVLGYEKDPFLQNQLWFRKGVTIVNEYEQGQPPSDSVYWDDARYAHTFMINAGFVHIDSFSYNFGDSSLDVVNAINDGRSYILYRGIGVNDWLWPFDGIHPDQMNNGFKLPIVISATCATIEGIGYEWMNAGTPEQPKGTVGFLGTTTALFAAAEMRSALTKGTLESIFCDSFATLGRATESGRLKYYELFGNTLEYDSWNCLGDPEMNVWTTTPKQIQVSHFPEAWLGATLMVNVRHNSIPVESALVCVMAKYDSSVYHYGYTDNGGNIRFLDSLYFPDTALLTVTGRNLLPLIDTVIAGYSGGPYVTYKSHLILDTISGNGNYQPNNGEDIELAVWVINYGDSSAYNVSGVLQKAEPDGYYQLSDTTKYFGDIASLDSAFTSEDGFNIIIDPDCPDSHQINLKLTLHDADSTWISYFDFLVYSPRPYIIYKTHSILDTIGGNGNFQINPGENIELAVWIQNIGDSIAEDVNGILQKQEPDEYFSLDDTIKYFGDILPMDSAWTSEDGYNILVDSTCPDQHEIKLRLKITDSLDSLWIYNISLINYAPNFVFNDYFIDDSLKYISHGDSANIIVFIKNTGSSIAENLMGTLISNDTLVIIIEGNASFGTISPDSIGSNQSNPFIIASDSLTPLAYSTNLKLALNAGTYQDTIDFDIYIGQKDYLVWDPDPNHTSGFIIHTKLTGLNFLGDYRQVFPLGYLNVYKTLLVSIGMYPEKYIIYDTSAVVPEIEYFLDTDGKMYLEGGDVWYLDPESGGYDFCPYFSISPVSNNIGYFTGISGVDNTFTQGMSFDYSGESSSIDRINPAGSSISIFKNAFNDYGCGVAANHQTVGVSIEYNGLVDGSPPSTKIILIDSIMQYFGIPPTGIKDYNQIINEQQITFFISPNPFRKLINIRFSIGHPDRITHSSYGTGSAKSIALKIYDVDNNRRVAQGIYFIRLVVDYPGQTENYQKTEKVIFLK